MGRETAAIVMSEERSSAPEHEQDFCKKELLSKTIQEVCRVPTNWVYGNGPAGYQEVEFSEPLPPVLNN